MNFFGFLLLGFALSTAEAKIELAQEGPIYVCEARDGEADMDLQITEGMMALITRFGPKESYRYSRDTTWSETGRARFISDDPRLSALKVTKGILEGRQKGAVWEAKQDGWAWDCEIKPPEPQATNRFVKVHELKEIDVIKRILRLKDGRIVTVTLGNFNLNVWTQGKFGFSKSHVLKGPTTFIETVIELRNGSLASLSPRSGEVRIWTETPAGNFESKIFDIGIDGGRPHSFIESKNGTLVVTNGTELVFLKPQSDGSYRVSRKALPVTGANDVFELSKGRLLVTYVLSGGSQAVLLEPKADDYEISMVKTPRNENMLMLPGGQIASIIYGLHSAHFIEIWNSDFVVGGDNVERWINQYDARYMSLTELESGDIVFLGADNTLRLWHKSDGLVELLANHVVPDGTLSMVRHWLPVITPNKSKPSFLFVDRDTATVWEEQP